jgi:periplasmic protein CpxP/Spy
MNTLKQLAAAGLLAAAGCAALAQPQTPPQPMPMPMPMQPGQPPMMMRGDHGDRRAMMEQHRARRLGELKQKLQISAAQEGAWTNWTNALKPGARPQRPNFVEFARMTTPQRIDKMRELRNARNAERDRRGDATKAFYAQLNAQQQKVFDEQSMGMMGRGGKGRHGGMGGMGMGMGHHGGR